MNVIGVAIEADEGETPTAAEVAAFTRDAQRAIGMQPVYRDACGHALACIVKGDTKTAAKYLYAALVTAAKDGDEAAAGALDAANDLARIANRAEQPCAHQPRACRDCLGATIH